MKNQKSASIFILITSISILGLQIGCEKDNDENQNDDGLTFTDNRDNQTYKYVKIGDQYWMAENLNYNAGSGSWVYDNNSYYATTYGRLYNWETACDVCPAGWHLPSDAEFTELENYLSSNGYNGTEGTALKATAGWNSGGNGTDNYGFSALPGGGLLNGSNSSFSGLGYYGYWWSSTQYSSSSARLCNLSYFLTLLYRYYDDKSNGYSVRCVKD